LSVGGQGRQSLSLFHRRGACEDGRICLALSDHARRQLGLYRHPAYHARRHGDWRTEEKSADAGAQERLLLRAGPHQRQTAVGEEFRAGQLGQRHRHDDRPPDRKSGGALLQDRQAVHRLPR
ncbi:hypothetical protein LTR94_033554, partial [Friedmanniomyces endolithicus]